MGGLPFLAKLKMCPPPVNEYDSFILHDYICNYVAC